MESIEMSISKSNISHGSYIVKSGDSLVSIAARFGNVTPSQLARFNRLGMLGASHPPLFPGQRLYIPNKDEVCSQNVRLPGAATRVRYLSADSTESGSGVVNTPRYNHDLTLFPSTQDAVMERLFVKVRAKRIILPSKREIDGVLIVTPDAICFDAIVTACAMNRVASAKIDSLQRLPAVASDDGGGGGSPLPEVILEAAEPVHDVLALSICIPIAAVTSLNTHVDMQYLLSLCCPKAASKAALPKDSTESATTLPDSFAQKSEALRPHRDVAESVSSSVAEAAEGREHAQLPEEIFISVGVKTDRVLFSVASRPTSTDHITLSEASTSSIHIFKVPIDKLEDIYDILVSATNLASNQSISLPPRSPVSQQARPASMIESALEEMEKNVMEISLMGNTSCILNESMLKDLSKGLPANRVGSAMRLVFSTSKDGFSLNTLYRKTKSARDVNLLLIRDQLDSVFGALLSERMHCSQHFYGTGESCVFHWRDGFKCYNWTKKNYFFMQGSHHSFLIGAQSGHSAIWFDGDLKYGRSEATDTFDNPVLCSIPNVDSLKMTAKTSKGPTSVAFVVSALEVWEMLA